MSPGSIDEQSKITAEARGDESETKNLLAFTLFDEPKSKKERLAGFLAKEAANKGEVKSGRRYTSPKHAELEALRDELVTLIGHEQLLTVKERSRIRMEKEKLAADINLLEVQVEKFETERRTGMCVQYAAWGCNDGLTYTHSETRSNYPDPNGPGGEEEEIPWCLS
jgi:hypothetical protein